MSIQSEIDRIKNNVTGTYSAISEMGGTVPDEQNSDNLADAVKSIPQGPTYTAGPGIYIEDDVIGSLLPSKAISQENYDLLSNDEKNSDVLWIISDASPDESEVIPDTLNECSWELISKLSKNNTFKDHFSVGDTKTIVLNGQIGNGLTANNLEIDLVVAGINHNETVEGGNIVHFIFGKINGNIIALTDDAYMMNPSTDRYFTMNLNRTNSGGWEASQMRSNIMGGNGTPTNPVMNSLMAALPSDLRKVMRPVSKWTYNDSLSATSEYLCLPGEFEVFGSRRYANVQEQKYQLQYPIYTNSSYKNPNKSSDFSTSANVLLRSPDSEDNDDFCGINNGAFYDYAANFSRGITPLLFV